MHVKDDGELEEEAGLLVEDSVDSFEYGQQFI